MSLLDEVVCGLLGLLGPWDWVGGWMRGNLFTGGSEGLGKMLEGGRLNSGGVLQIQLSFFRALKHKTQPSSVSEALFEEGYSVFRDLQSSVEQ